MKVLDQTQIVNSRASYFQMLNSKKSSSLIYSKQKIENLVEKMTIDINLLKKIQIHFYLNTKSNNMPMFTYMCVKMTEN